MGAHILDAAIGTPLSVEHQRIAELINEYSPQLELAWVPPAQRALNEQFPFAIIHRPVGLEPYVVFRLRENEVDHRVIARLWAADNNHQTNILSDIERDEQARRLVLQRKAQDDREEAMELAAWAIQAKAGAKHNGVRFE